MQALVKHSTAAMKESRVLDILDSVRHIVLDVTTSFMFDFDFDSWWVCCMIEDEAALLYSIDI